MNALKCDREWRNNNNVNIWWYVGSICTSHLLNWGHCCGSSRSFSDISLAAIERSNQIVLWSHRSSWSALCSKLLLACFLFIRVFCAFIYWNSRGNQHGKLRTYLRTIAYSLLWRNFSPRFRAFPQILFAMQLINTNERLMLAMRVYFHKHSSAFNKSNKKTKHKKAHIWCAQSFEKLVDLTVHILVFF